MSVTDYLANRIRHTALLVAVVLGVSLVPPLPASGAWSYDGTAGTITDGNWTLKVSGSSTNLTLTGYVAGEGDLDLSSLSTDTNRTVVQRSASAP